MNPSRTWLFFFALFLCAAPALAGPLATDGTSYQGVWHGTTGYVGVPASGGLAGTIDWAVYAPGVFPAGFTPVGGYVPSPGEYLYAYQGIETGPASLTSVSVVLDNFAHNIGNFTATGISGQASASSLLLAFDSATWSFAGVLTGASTDGLAFFSPNVPEMTEATTIDHGTTGLALPVPSPSSSNIPEPSSLVLAVCGLVGLSYGWLRRRQAAKVC